MNQLRILFIIIILLAPSISLAAPLVTISCDTPKGSRMEYGVSSPERVQAEIGKNPAPKPHLKGPMADGYLTRPTFIVDSTKKKLTVIWSESEADLKQKEESKKLGVPYCCSPPPATDAEVAIFTPDQISALQITVPNDVTVYSFFPKLGTAFITSQGIDAWKKNADVLSFFATCEFSWSGSH